MRNYFMIMLVAVLASCSTSTFSTVETTRTDSVPAAGIPSLAELPGRAVSELVESLTGSEFIYSHNVTADGYKGVFAPDWQDGSGELAFAVYRFSLDDYGDVALFRHSWSVLPEEGTQWIGLGNQALQRWDWVQLDANERYEIYDLQSYLNEDDDLTVVFILLGDKVCELNSLDISNNPPWVSWVSPELAEPFTEVQFTGQFSGLSQRTILWDFGGGALPNTSAEPSPVVVAQAEGNYDASLQITDALGSHTYEFTLIVKDWHTELGESELAAVPLQETAVVGEPVKVIVYCGDLPEDAPLAMLNGAAVTFEAGGDYVWQTYDVGSPGGGQQTADGFWQAMAPLPQGFLWPYDGLFISESVNGSPGLEYIGFVVAPVGASSMLSGGILFNFEIAFDTPGTYNLGFLEHQDVKRTYYSTETAQEFYWDDISNAGVPHTITVTAE